MCRVHVHVQSPLLVFHAASTTFKRVLYIYIYSFICIYICLCPYISTARISTHVAAAVHIGADVFHDMCLQWRDIATLLHRRYSALLSRCKHHHSSIFVSFPKIVQASVFDLAAFQAAVAKTPVISQEEAHQAFSTFDTHANGYMALPELTDILKNLGEGLDDAQIAKFKTVQKLIRNNTNNTASAVRLALVGDPDGVPPLAMGSAPPRKRSQGIGSKS